MNLFLAALVVGWWLYGFYKLHTGFADLERMKRIRHEWEMKERVRASIERDK